MAATAQTQAQAPPLSTQTTQATLQPPAHMSREATQQSLKRSQTGTAAMRLPTDPFAGSVGHLNERQANAFEQFKQVITQKGLYRPPTDNARASHDDGTLLRFLRARKFDVNGAFGQFAKTEQWRNDNQIEALYDNIDVEDYQQAWALYPQWTGRRDKRGIPVYVFKVGNLNSKSMNAYNKSAAKTVVPNVNTKKGGTPPRLMRLFALYENLTKFVQPLCSHLPRLDENTPIVSSNNIVDISGVGLRQFWNLKNHMGDASQLATAHYPETLDRIFIIGAPSFFPTLWGWVKGWFDPVTVAKIFILKNNDMQKVLETYIDPQDIPQAYGGGLNWEFGQPPNVDEDVRHLFGENSPLGRQWVPGPLRWMEDNGSVVAVGSAGGQLRRDVVGGQ